MGFVAVRSDADGTWAGCRRLFGPTAPGPSVRRERREARSPRSSRRTPASRPGGERRPSVSVPDPSDRRVRDDRARTRRDRGRCATPRSRRGRRASERFRRCKPEADRILGRRAARPSASPSLPRGTPRAADHGGSRTGAVGRRPEAPSRGGSRRRPPQERRRDDGEFGRRRVDSPPSPHASSTKTVAYIPPNSWGIQT